jgi:hypothetical protein
VCVKPLPPPAALMVPPPAAGAMQDRLEQIIEQGQTSGQP